MRWWTTPMRNAFNFSGRSTRAEFWIFSVINGVIVNILGLEVALWGVPVLTILYILLIAIPAQAVLVRRLHDMGRSGWWALLVFTIIGAIIPYVFALAGSDPDTNEYGPNPYAKKKRLKKYGKNTKRTMQVTTCPSCGARQKENAKFCTSCGTALRTSDAS